MAKNISLKLLLGIIFIVIYFVTGIIFAVAAIRTKVEFVISLNEDWSRVIFGVLSLFFLYMGLNMVKGLQKPELTIDEREKLRPRVRILGRIEIMAGVILAGLCIYTGISSEAIFISDIGRFFFLVVSIQLVFTGAILQFNFTSFERSMLKRKSLEKGEGLPGRAVFKEINDLGGNEFVMEADLLVEITVDRQQSYTVKCKESVPRLGFARLVPGGSVPITIDPTNPNFFVFHWNKP